MKTKLQTVRVLIPSGIPAQTLTEIKFQFDSNYDNVVGLALCTNNDIFSPASAPMNIGLRKDEGIIIDDILHFHFIKGITIPEKKSYVPINCIARGHYATLRITTIGAVNYDCYMWLIFKLIKND